jgi:hypothetical protein
MDNWCRGAGQLKQWPCGKTKSPWPW